MPTGYIDPQTLQVSPKAPVEANATSATLTVANMGKIQTNTGAVGAVALTLPAAADAAGCAFRVYITAAQPVTIEPGGVTEKIYLGGDGVANKHLAIAGVIGNFAELYSDGETWLVTYHSGVATKEA